MKNKNWVIGIILLVAIIGLLIYAFFRNNNNSAPQSEYTPSQISADVNVTNNNGVNNSTTNTTANENVKKVETKVGGFSTPIVDDNKNRVNNIKITCSRINGTIVKPGEEFSFCDVVGQPSADDGYKEAHAFVNGKLVNATRQIKSSGVGNDPVLDERKKSSELFIESFREIAPKLRTVTVGKSMTSQAASEILDEWKIFLR